MLDSKLCLTACNTEVGSSFLRLESKDAFEKYKINGYFHFRFAWKSAGDDCTVTILEWRQSWNIFETPDDSVLAAFDPATGRLETNFYNKLFIQFIY